MQIDRYIPPPEHPLHPYVASIWRAESQFSHSSETILPKQNVDLLFNLGEPQHVVGGTRSPQRGLNDFHVAGPQTGALTVQPQGNMNLLGVSLKMDGCSGLLALPMTELTDQTVEAHNIFPQQRFLWEQVAEAHSFEAQRNLLMRWLIKALQPTPHLDLVQHACWSLREQPTSHTLDQLSAQLNLSSRHLRRIMLHHVGLGPAQYMRLSRFVKSLHLMPKVPSLTDIAYNVHYADQAHFCRDFKEIAGMTPSEYRQCMSHIPGQIFHK
jgi:AraC-like DNA-binding protein